MAGGKLLALAVQEQPEAEARIAPGWFALPRGVQRMIAEERKKFGAGAVPVQPVAWQAAFEWQRALPMGALFELPVQLELAPPWQLAQQ